MSKLAYWMDIVVELEKGINVGRRERCKVKKESEDEREEEKRGVGGEEDLFY